MIMSARAALQIIKTIRPEHLELSLMSCHMTLLNYVYETTAVKESLETLQSLKRSILRRE